MKILGIIPARYESARFPGKPLADICGKSMIQRVYEQCEKAQRLAKIIVATDDQRIFDVVKEFGGEVMMTGEEHLNGTSRCTEVVKNAGEHYDHIINIQGDEPLVHPAQIDELASLFEDKTAQIVTQAKTETDLSLLENPNIVKVILDENKYAVDFIRICEPSTGSYHPFYKHIGIYGFNVDVLKDIVHLTPTLNETDRKLEQMRWLDNGYLIKVGITEYNSISVDNIQDLEKVIDLLHV